MFFSCKQKFESVKLALDQLVMTKIENEIRMYDSVTEHSKEALECLGTILFMHDF